MFQYKKYPLSFRLHGLCHKLTEKVRNKCPEQGKRTSTAQLWGPALAFGVLPALGVFCWVRHFAVESVAISTASAICHILQRD